MFVKVFLWRSPHVTLLDFITCSIAQKITAFEKVFRLSSSDTDLFPLGHVSFPPPPSVSVSSSLHSGVSNLAMAILICTDRVAVVGVTRGYRSFVMFFGMLVSVLW